MSKATGVGAACTWGAAELARKMATSIKMPVKAKMGTLGFMRLFLQKNARGVYRI
jgi:hypothetical protein